MVESPGPDILHNPVGDDVVDMVHEPLGNGRNSHCSQYPHKDSP